MLPLAMALATPYAPDLPDDAVGYAAETQTQAVSRLDDRPRIQLVPVRDLPDRRWHRSGGLLGVKAGQFSSRKYRSGGRPTYAVKPVPVTNSLGYVQHELGLTRTYPDGARFDDVLTNAAGVVFEHRVREKAAGRWTSRVEHRDAAARPDGYAGLTEACASCHNEAGTGGYAAGLVPGGDTVLSDPMDWAAVPKGLVR